VEQDCLYNGWCYEADLNYDFTVDFKGSAALASWPAEMQACYFSLM